MSRVRVNQGKSVCQDGIWYDQRAEFECPDPKAFGDDVTILDAPKPTKPEKSDSSGKES
jgi:hypothetical protein